MSGTLAIIGGTGLTELPELTITETHDLQTPFGAHSAAILEGRLHGERVIFISRHGQPHRIPPHMVNYRANLLALQSLQVTDVLAINAVGGITKNMKTGALVVPKQIIDYTYGREMTIFDGEFAPVTHVDFSNPYSESMRAKILVAAEKVGEKVINGGVYGATQGPRLETAAEVFRMENEGNDIIGMTGMPEASIARELKLNYASLSFVVNPAAGKGPDVITIKEMQENVTEGMKRVRSIISQLVIDFSS